MKEKTYFLSILKKTILNYNNIISEEDFIYFRNLIK